MALVDLLNVVSMWRIEFLYKCKFKRMLIVQV